MAAQRKYPDELRERAVRIVFEIRELDGKGHGEISRVARLLDQATASQARRVTAAAQTPDPAMLTTIDAADIPGQIHPHDPPADDQWPGQYL